jgi:CheY-like chemotaxis protein
LLLGLGGGPNQVDENIKKKQVKIVMDVSMSEMDGIEAMKAIRKIVSTIPILLSSGCPESEFTFTTDQVDQPNGFLPKPFDISGLQSNLAKILPPCRPW